MFAETSSALAPSLVDSMFSNEQLFVESLEQLISSSGTTQQHCIAQLRSLGLPDDFWMYVFKVVPCAKTYSHKWTLCPCAHAGETARRRDPRVVNYRAVLCPIVKGKKTCPLGDSCSYAHNVFEHWLHPSRYKTRLCSFGRNCNRPICFFAHSADELRCVPNSDDGKEVDEREYMLQVMMAQQNDGAAGNQQQLMASRMGSMSSPATPMNGIHSLNAFCPSPLAQNPYASLMDPLASPMPSPQSAPQNMAGSHAQLAAQQAQLASYLNASPIRVKPSLNHQHSLPSHLMTAASNGLHVNDAALQLMGLQEALAAMNLQQAMESNGGGVHGGSLGATPHSSASRASDPGMPGAASGEAALKMLNGMTMNRISESGQPTSHGNMGLTSPKGLAASIESLLPFMNSLQQQQQPQHPKRSSSGGFGSNGGNGSVPASSGGSLTQPNPAQTAAGQPVRPQSPPPSPALRRTSSPVDSSASGSPPNHHHPMQQHLQHHQQNQHQMLQQGRASMTGDSQDARLSQHDQQQQFQRQMSDPSALMNFPTSRTNSHTRQPPARTASVGPLFMGNQQQMAFMQQQQQQQQQQALQALAAAAGGSGAVGAGTMNKIVSELQEQGLAGSKDQLVASLSNLLAQLLSSSPSS